MQARSMRVLPALVLSAVLAPSAVPGSDNDERPAYMIYIDPETGKYTTEDPMRRRTTDYAGQTSTSAPDRERAEPSGSRARDSRKADGSAPFVIGIGATLLLTAFAWRLVRRRSGRVPGRP